MTSRLQALPPRLAAIASLVPEGSVVADVGAGHGKLAAHLASSGRSPRVVVIDRSPEELAAAVRAPGLVFRLGDGLAALHPGDGVETVIVAGMGGAGIARIVARRPRGRSAGRWILQPQTEAARLREALAEAGLRLVDERLVEDAGRFYAILVAEPGEAADPSGFPGLTREDVLAAGPCLLRLRPPELERAWSQQRDRLARIASRGGAEAGLARALRILAYLATSGPAG